MAGKIAFNPDSVRVAMKNLLLSMENGGDASLTNMQTNVKQFSVNGYSQTNGGIEPLTMLTQRLRETLAFRSADARELYDELVEALDTLELIIADLNAREDENTQASVDMLVGVQEIVENSITPTTPNSTGQGGGGSLPNSTSQGGGSISISNPSADDIKGAGGFESGDQSS